MTSEVCRAVRFDAPGVVTVEERAVPTPAANEVLVRTECSAISAGTEGLLHRGEMPHAMMQDATIEALQGDSGYPLTYGYAAVGRVIVTGRDVESNWKDRRVFAFHPHVSHFTASPAKLVSLPDDLSNEDATFIPNLETAVTLVLDAQPLIGEHAIVSGAGVVGLLTLGLLRQFPLETLLSVEPHGNRQKRATQWGAQASLAPADASSWVETHLGDGADFLVEASGAPAALDQALELMRNEGRIVVGSWYGTKAVPLSLGRSFHRKRLQLLSSQVSSLRADLTGRWTKERRLRTVVREVKQLKPSTLISHRVPIGEAATAYTMLEEVDDTLQILLTYP